MLTSPVLKGFFKKHRSSTITLVLGMLFIFIASERDTLFIAPPFARLSNYIGWLLILFAWIAILAKYKNVFTIILANISILATLILIIEICCFFWLGMPAKTIKNFKQASYNETKLPSALGSIPLPDSVYREVLMNGQDTSFDVQVSIDEFYRRITPDHDTAKKQYALFFGGSIAFGYGLDDYETMPYQFQQISGTYNSYNYAHNGHGPAQMLARMQHHNLSVNTAEKDGKAIYIFFWDHIYRSVGTMDRYARWVSTFPYYTIEDGELIRKGNFRNGRPILSWVYEHIYNSCIIKTFNIDFPLKINDQHLDLTTEIILKSKETYAEQFGNDDFYLVFHPTYIRGSEEETNKFKTLLEAKNIRYIDLQDFIIYSGKYTLKGDPHPNANTAKLIAEELLRRVEE